MLLVDSSVWIAIEGGLVDLVPLARQTDLAVCPAIVQEVLRGANTPKQLALLREVLRESLILDSPTPLARFEEAALLYLRCRSYGYAMTGFDCLIAASAIAHEIELLHADEDFDRIQRIEPRLKIRRLTRSASAPNS